MLKAIILQRSFTKWLLQFLYVRLLSLAMYKTEGVEFLTGFFEINWRKIHIQIERYICVNIDAHLLKPNQH